MTTESGQIGERAEAAPDEGRLLTALWGNRSRIARLAPGVATSVECKSPIPSRKENLLSSEDSAAQSFLAAVCSLDDHTRAVPLTVDEQHELMDLVNTPTLTLAQIVRMSELSQRHTASRPRTATQDR